MYIGWQASVEKFPNEFIHVVRMLCDECPMRWTLTKPERKLQFELFLQNGWHDSLKKKTKKNNWNSSLYILIGKMETCFFFFFFFHLFSIPATAVVYREREKELWWLRYLVTRLFFFFLNALRVGLPKCRTNEDAIGIFFFLFVFFLFQSIRMILGSVAL